MKQKTYSVLQDYPNGPTTIKAVIHDGYLHAVCEDGRLYTSRKIFVGDSFQDNDFEKLVNVRWNDLHGKYEF